MNRMSNTVIGFLNILTLVSSIVMIGSALWMGKSKTTCEHFLQKPLLVLGLAIMVLSLAGLIGACCDVAWVLWVYLFFMVFIIVALMGLTLFGFIVTSHGGGVGVTGRVYKEFKLEEYHPWLKTRVMDANYWLTIKTCLLSSLTCSKLSLWTPIDYLQKDLTPLQSGCCKPPTSCVYNTETPIQQESDCYRWNNAATVLCYDCDSCRAGVLETVRRDWHKLSIVNVVIVLFLIAIYCVGCCAFKNAKRPQYYGFPYGRYGMSKSRPGWEQSWSRWWHGRDRYY
ncbi:hypothetical protein BRARA_A01341 [Brassica rapa]|uniref:Uncharacterized protein n=2 Tax=Brassica TaxID=3705 RepID=A0A398ATF2_BRACM|nr:tetraspanin-5 [Brassica napus]RID78526.1 hypothetical protein BRARA_A01341 [Brassica rapa]KAH0941671.1 hypothetical protein HID58_001308 [Brassica napus]CAF2149341.1 unnamed protein product [Brassica napus]CAG7887394.1 unnamed protein product [Brassica rapa]VDC74900.1 unnamed protein product [Brassica rapa]